MKDYKTINNYIGFEELDTDSLGTNYRAGEIKDRKAEKHCLLTEVYPALATDPVVWRRVKTLIEGIKNQNIPGLFSPEHIIEDGEKGLLVYPFLNGKSFENLLEDAAKTDEPIDLELTFAMVMEIADVLDSSSAIVINKKKSYHGILTPDNIVVDFDGKISLRNYGIFPYLDNAPQLLSGTVKKYENMIAPELLQNKGISAQTDIYHLGNITYRLLTGEYFRYSSEEDFESRLSNIELSLHITPPQEDFPQKIGKLFKRALNPDPGKRFASIKEFKEQLSSYFHVQELSSATFMIAYFMNILYKKAVEEQEKHLTAELAYTLPETKPVLKEPSALAVRKIDESMMEDILIELEQQKRSRIKIIIPFVVVLIAVLAISGYLILKQQGEVQRQKEAQVQREQEYNRLLAQMREELNAEYKRRLEEIEKRNVTSTDEKQTQAEEIARLKQWQKDQEEFQAKRLKELQAAQQMRESGQKPAEIVKLPESTGTVPVTQPDIKVPEEQPQPVVEQPKPTSNALNAGDLVALGAVTFSPSKMSGKRTLTAGELDLPYMVLENYKGKNLSIRSEILVDESGSVVEVIVMDKIPTELEARVSQLLKTWNYIPAEKNKVKVKVWIPAEVTVAFEGAVKAPIPIMALDAVTYQPSKISGAGKVKADELRLSKEVKNKYKGSVTVDSEVLIDAGGSVAKVNIKGDWPEELKSKVEVLMKSWTYVPAEKDKIKVQVWMPAALNITFEAEPPKVAAAAPAPIVSLDAVTYKPSKMSGPGKVEAKDFKLPKNITDKYKGTVVVNTTILIDDAGNVARVDVKGDWPTELKAKVENFMKGWSYIAAEKDKAKVQVWMPADLIVVFEGVPSKPVETKPAAVTVTTAAAPPASAPIVPLESVTYKPSKLSGSGKVDADNLKLSKGIKDQYKGQTLTVNLAILIDETGKVAKVDVKDNLPVEIKSKVEGLMKDWKYEAAEKDKAKVKVWIPTELTIRFEGEKEAAVEIPKSLTPLDAVNFKPSKITGKNKLDAAGDLKLSKDTREQYKGKTLNVDTSVLINEVGKVIKVEVKGDLPYEIKTKVTEQLKNWTYEAAEKDKTKVAVWLPVKVTITF